MTIVTSRWPPLPLPYSRGQNEAPGLSELITQSAANVATQYAHIVGAAEIGGQPSGAPVNPSGDYGHDHSGGIFGRALYRSVVTATTDNGSGYSSVVLEGDANYLTIEDGADSVTTYSRGTHEHLVWIPPCDPVEGAYIELRGYARVRLFSTALLAGDTLTYEMWADDETRAQSVTISAPNTAALKNADFSSNKIRVTPGRMNVIYTRAKVVRTTGGSARGCILYPQELQLNVYSV